MRCPHNKKYLCIEGHTCDNCLIFLNAKQTRMDMTKMSKKEQLTWMQKEKKRLQEERRKTTGQEFRNLFIPQVGENKLQIYMDEPRLAETRYGTRNVLKVETEDGKQYDLMINPKSPLWRDIIDKLCMTPIENPKTIIIVRSGTGKLTRYSLK